ncbi:MAG: hypothetical protein ABW092_20095 [Candidatus Thiodiazotropha sp.]
MTSKHIHIMDKGILLKLDYEDALKFHQGNAYWGCALAFRMLQFAEKLLSREKTWERHELSIESGHPGPGVRDTIEYVTGCVSGGRYRLTCSTTEARCVSDMAYSWRISDAHQSLLLELADGIVSEEFLGLLDKINRNEADEEHHERLEFLKKSMTKKIWSLELEQAFGNLQLTEILASASD